MTLKDSESSIKSTKNDSEQSVQAASESSEQASGTSNEAPSQATNVFEPSSDKKQQNNSTNVKLDPDCRPEESRGSISKWRVCGNKAPPKSEMKPENMCSRCNCLKDENLKCICNCRGTSSTSSCLKYSALTVNDDNSNKRWELFSSNTRMPKNSNRIQIVSDMVLDQNESFEILSSGMENVDTEKVSEECKIDSPKNESQEEAKVYGTESRRNNHLVSDCESVERALEENRTDVMEAGNNSNNDKPVGQIEIKEYKSDSLTSSDADVSSLHLDENKRDIEDDVQALMKSVKDVLKRSVTSKSDDGCRRNRLVNKANSAPAEVVDPNLRAEPGVHDIKAALEEAMKDL